MITPCFTLRDFCWSILLLCSFLLLPKLKANTLEHIPVVDCNTFSGITYVDGSATGTNDGTSWADAFTDLQNALRARQDCLGAIDTILVAQGTYYPTPGSTNRDTSFWIPDGVVVLGGFPSGGGALSSRDWNVYETILSGDIDGNNASSGNSYHVVRTRNVSSATVVDGFTITGGNANGSGSNDSGGGWYNDGSGTGNSSNPAIRNCIFNINSAGNTGGAIYNNGVDGESSPTLINCVLSENQAGFHGGAVNNNGSSGVSSPTFIDCVLSGNQADSRGGALYNYNSFGVCSPTFINCVLSGNEADSEGGAIYNNNAFGESSPEFTNCVLSGNAAQDGAAIYNYGSFGESSPQLTNCVLSGNEARFYGGAIYTMGNNGENSPILTNCILYQNDAISAPVFFNDNSTTIVSYSLFDVDFATVNHNGNAIDNGNNKYSTNPQFVFAPPASAAPTTAGDFQLLPTSPAFNMGDPATDLSGFYMVSGVPVDLDGNPRVLNQVIDMGVYEAENCNIVTATDAQLTACEVADQVAEFDLDDAQADVNGGTGVSYAYYSDSTAMVNISSSYQATDGTTVYVVVTHEATQCIDTAAITLQVRPAPSVTCAADTTVAACLSQAVIDQAFADWLGGFTTDCADCMVSDLSEYAAPDSCGGATTIKFVVWDDCGVAKDSCEASFAVPAPMMVSVNCPMDLVVPDTWPKAEIQSAYEDWLASIETSGGCAITVEHTGSSSPNPAQTCLDAVTEVTWMVSNGCAQTMTCTARFTIQATMGGEEGPNCGTFSPSVSDQGEIVVSSSDFLTNAASVEYPVMVEIYNQWGGTEQIVELADYCATAVWNICNNLGNELSFSA